MQATYAKVATKITAPVLYIVRMRVKAEIMIRMTAITRGRRDHCSASFIA
jgi:hypothetical protein